MTHLFIRWLLVSCWLLVTSTTSATSVTDTPRSSTVPPMLPPANCPVLLTSRRPRLTPRSAKRRTPTGRAGTPRRRMVLAAAAAAIPTSSTSKARKAPAWLSGLMLLVAGPALKHLALSVTTEGVSRRWPRHLTPCRLTNERGDSYPKYINRPYLNARIYCTGLRHGLKTHWS